MATYLGAEYQLLTTTTAGVPYAEIANAQIESVTWELNGWGEATFSMAVDDPQAYTELQPDYQTKREIQIWRNGVLIWWGIYVAASADQDQVTFIAYGLLWYFARRYFGPVHSNAMPQLLTNGDFENPTVLGGWGASSVSITATSSATRRHGGARALKMVTASSGNTDFYIAQGVAIPTPARTRQLIYTVSAWMFRETITTREPGDRALALFPATAGGASLPPQINALVQPDAALGVWQYLEASLTLPASTTGQVGVALYAPANGTVYYDDVRLTYEQRTGAIEGEDWSDSYLRRIFSYGAGLTGGGGPSSTWWGASVNKSSLNMTFTGSGSATPSLTADLFWNHADEGNIYAAMADLAARNVLDMEITWATDGRSRTMTSYVPRKGSTKTGLAAEDGRNVVSFRYDVDGRRRANDVRVVGRSRGTVKDEGQAGGPTVSTAPQLETIISPQFELSGQNLVDLAGIEQARLTNPLRTPTITVHAGVYMGDVDPGGGTAEAGAPLVVGDTIPVRIAHGWVQENANRRVVKMTLRPATETLDLTFNE